MRVTGTLGIPEPHLTLLRERLREHPGERAHSENLGSPPGQDGMVEQVAQLAPSKRSRLPGWLVLYAALASLQYSNMGKS